MLLLRQECSCFGKNAPASAGMLLLRQGCSCLGGNALQENMIKTGKAAAVLASNKWQRNDPAAQETFFTVAEHLKSMCGS